jgi:hypothetical protein
MEVIKGLIGKGSPGLESESLYPEHRRNATWILPNQNDRKSFRAQK